MPNNYKFKALQTRISNPVLQIMIPNRNYKSIADNSCRDLGLSSNWNTKLNKNKFAWNKKQELRKTNEFEIRGTVMKKILLAIQ